MPETRPNVRFVLKFYSNIGRTVRLSIPRACMDKTGAQARQAMQAILQSNAILNASTGRPFMIKGVSRIKTGREYIVE